MSSSTKPTGKRALEDQDGPTIVSSLPGDPRRTHRRWPKQRNPIMNGKDIPNSWEWDSRELDLEPEYVCLVL